PAPHGVCSAHGPQAADWEWGHRKCRTTRGQFALERPQSLLVSRQCRGHSLVAVVLQSGSVEHVETYGYITPCFAGSLIGKMGTRPPVREIPAGGAGADQSRLPRARHHHGRGEGTPGVMAERERGGEILALSLYRAEKSWRPGL